MTQQITLVKDKILSDNYFTLHNAKKKTVVLIRQFRVATWVNGNESG